MNLLVYALAEIRFAVVILHDIQAFVDGLLVLERKDHPAAQQATTHRRHRFIDDIEQALAVFLHGINQFQRTDSKLIQTHILILFDARDRCDMPYLRVLCLLQILQDGPRSNHAALQMIYAKALQVLYAEVLQQLLTRCLVSIYPVVELEGKEAVAKLLFEVLLTTPFEEHFLGLKVTQKLLHIVSCTLACQELASRDIEEGHTKGRFAEMHAGQEVVLLVIQHVIRHSHTWRHQLRDASLHQFLRQFWVLQLIADSHTLACSDQLWQIGIQRMMRKARHLVAQAASTIISMCQRDTQDA